MAWIFASVVLALLVLSAGFRQICRRLMIIVIPLVLLVGLGFGAHHLWEQYQLERAKTLVSVDQLLIDGLKAESRSPSFYRISGRIKNTSDHGVEQLRLGLWLSDCVMREGQDNGGTGKPWEKYQCEIVGQTSQLLLVSIPPGQVRHFEETIYFGSSAEFRGGWALEQKVIEVIAEL